MALAVCNPKTDPQGRELTRHGTALFPVACYYDNLGRESVPWHWHDEFEVLTVTEGQAVVAIGSERYTVSQGAGFFINAGVLHAAWDIHASNCRFHSVVFHPRLIGGLDSVFWQSYLKPLLEDDTLKSIYLESGVSWKQEMIDFIEYAWKNCVEEQAGYEFKVRHALSQLIFLITCHHPAVISSTSEKETRNAERAKIMLQYIQEHFSEELTTRDIARSALISESECLRCFKSTLSISPIQYVRHYRIQKAAELLLSTEQKISDIATYCGFQEMSYFSKAFRDLYECTPSQYRLHHK